MFKYFFKNSTTWSGGHTKTFPIQISPIMEGAKPILITLTIPSLNIIMYLVSGDAVVTRDNLPVKPVEEICHCGGGAGPVSAVKSLSLN